MSTGVGGASTAGVDLDDGAALALADTGGLLRGAASAGAQIRATAAAIAEGGLGDLAHHSTRGVVLAAGPGPARHAGAILAELASRAAAVPVISATVVPRWVGPLDVVVVLADDPGDLELAESVARAGTRGAAVVMATPAQGPLAASGGGRALRFPPRVPVPAGMGFTGFVALGSAVFSELGVMPAVDLPALADSVDAQAARDHPAMELFASPARVLAARLQHRELVLAGAGAVTTMLARLAADSLLRLAGVHVAATDLGEVLASSHRWGANNDLVSDPMFDDPDLDGLRRRGLLVGVLATRQEYAGATQRSRALREIDMLTAVGPGEELAGGEVAEVSLLAARLQTAAVYLGLAR